MELAIGHQNIVTESMKFPAVMIICLGVVLTAGCKPNPKNITELQRKEAANLVSEAQFAVTMRDYARAEPLFAKAAKLCPDTGEYWLGLGMSRRRLGDKSGAKSAYEEALAAFRDNFDHDSKNADALLQQVSVLALLGRADEARSALEVAQKKHPENGALRRFVEEKQLDRIVSDPSFKEIAL